MRSLRLLLVLTLIFGAAGAYAQTAANPNDSREVYIFKGDDPNEDGIELGDWGSGKAVKSKERLLIGGWSVQVTSQGYYSGGKLDFTRPVALFSDGIDPNRYIQLAFFCKDTDVVNPAGANAAYYDIEPYTVPKASKMRFVFVSDTGTTVSVEEATNPLDPDDNWMRVAVPLAKFKNAIGDSKEFKLKRMLIFSSIPGTFYLGEMKLTTDNSPIKVDALDSRTEWVNGEIYFTAAAQGGVSSLKYTWDFDGANGIQPDATGMIARHIYAKGGEFKVTLTVSDADGIKAPVTVTGDVSISD